MSKLYFQAISTFELISMQTQNSPFVPILWIVMYATFQGLTVQIFLQPKILFSLLNKSVFSMQFSFKPLPVKQITLFVLKRTKAHRRQHSPSVFFLIPDSTRSNCNLFSGVFFFFPQVCYQLEFPKETSFSFPVTSCPNTL